jgi:hypothetical protein
MHVTTSLGLGHPSLSSKSGSRGRQLRSASHGFANEALLSITQHDAVSQRMEITRDSRNLDSSAASSLTATVRLIKRGSASVN